MHGETVLIGRGALVDIQAGGEDNVKPIRVIPVGDIVNTRQIAIYEILGIADCRDDD